LIDRLPIRLRLTLPFAIAMALLLAGTGVFVYLRVGSALMASVDSNLRSQLGEMQGHVERGEAIADRDASGAATVGEVVRSDGTVARSTPVGLGRLIAITRLHEVLSGRQVRWTAELPSLRGPWRLNATPVRTGSGAVAVVAAASLNARDEALDRLARELILGGAAVLLVAVAAGYLVAAAALRPVEALRARAAAITASTRARRLPVPAARDELARLAETLNVMLDRLEAAFEHERRFVADASHELRTPLAMLRTELELALRRPRSHDELERALRSAAEETERLSRLAEDLLLIARADQGRIPVRREQVDAAEVLMTVGERYRAAAQERARTIEVSTDEQITLDADRARLEQALGNLVSNALTYGAGTIGLAARNNGDNVELHVTDEGEGFAPEFVPRAFDRFSRADEARASDGTGLGLAIVELIADAHGGDANLANRDGGTDVWISLPGQREPRLERSGATAAR
jgi:two-component system, OmpR family, sensor kinase